ncbi:hypothetical protein [Clostridium sp.]|uniref:hypothetical protein n=1 Tax=Clostridium sp. TaxID=1506 RepID=UPI0032169BEE
MSKIFHLNDKPYELKTKEEIRREYEECTGKKYIQPTDEEKKETLKEYAQYMTKEQKIKYGLEE